MLSFPIESVREVIARGRADAEANGGFRNPHYGLHPGRDEQPGVWLVGTTASTCARTANCRMEKSRSSPMHSNAIRARTTTGSR
jgi:hypothetical protein